LAKACGTPGGTYRNDPGRPCRNFCPEGDVQARQSGGGAVGGLEAQDVEFPVDDVEHLLPVAVDVCSDVEAGRDRHLEGRCVGGVVVCD